MPDVINQTIGEKYALYHGDSCEIIKGLPDNSVHYTIFSPPFASLYTYSNSDRDMGNCKNDEEFYEHFKYLAAELYRVTMPGRLLSFHCMDLPKMKERDGVIGLKDFPAILRQVFEDCGFIYHSRVTIWKNPVTEMQRTKALGLLHKQIKKDSTMNRQGIPDYILTMRNPATSGSSTQARYGWISGSPTRSRRIQPGRKRTNGIYAPCSLRLSAAALNSGRIPGISCLNRLAVSAAYRM